MKELDPFKIMIAVVVFGSALYLAWFSYDSRQAQHCFAKYNDRVAQVTERRAQLASEDRASLVKLVRTVNTARSRETVSAALQEYLMAEDEIDRKRAASPIPRLQERACE